MKLRPYQQKMESEIYAFWNSTPGPSNAGAVSATGSGKTVLFSKFLKDAQSYRLAMAHRQELVGQMSVTLARNGVRHRIIAPDNVRRAIVQQQIVDVGTSFYDPSARTIAAGVDTLIRMQPESWMQQTGLVVVDECFPAGTLIDGRPIETLRPGDVVRAFNETTGALEPRTIVRLFKNIEPKHMMRIGASHHVLECTKGHPFYTRRGWVAAADLQLSDEVLIDQLHILPSRNSRTDSTATLPTTQSWRYILQTGMRIRAPDRDTKTPRQTRNPLGGVRDLRRTSRHDGTPPLAMENDRTRVLQPGMFRRLPRESVVGHDGANQCETRVSTHGHQQPNAKSVVAAENAGDACRNQTPTNHSRGEWAQSDASGSNPHDDVWGAGLRGATGYSYRHATRDGLPASVQAGHCQPCIKAGDRGRRGEPHGATASLGREKGRALKWARLDCIEIFQRDNSGTPGASRGDGYVYNIEVEGLHTYVAGGIVVHNCHHVLKANKWGQAVGMFPNAYGLMLTATPTRADGMGLGRHHDGLLDTLIMAPEMRDIINMGYLTDYRIVIAESDVRMGEDDVSAATGDFNMHKLREAHHASRRIVGDVVRAYLQYARGKLGLTFAVDIEEATKIAQAYRDAGVPAEVITGKTPTPLRLEILRKFKRRDLLQLVSVDIFGEGFDLPALEVVSFARHTNSFSLYSQMFGRALRLMLEQHLAAKWDTYTDAERRAAIAASKKPRAIIIDHVGNVLRHMGPPDARWRAGKWTLDRRDKRASAPSDAEPLRGCPNPDPHALGHDQPCNQPYERFRVSCPYCGHIPIPAERSTPEQVEGDMTMLDDEAAAAMREGVSFRLNSPVKYPMGINTPPEIKGACDRRHRERLASIAALTNAAAWWGGLCAAQGYSDGEAYKKFYLKFGIDVWSMQMLDRAEAEALHARIIEELRKHNVDGTVNAQLALTHH